MPNSRKRGTKHGPNLVRYKVLTYKRVSSPGGLGCLGYMSGLGMVELIKRDLLNGCTVGKIKFCEHCVFCKHKRVKFNVFVYTTEGTLDYVHADLWGLSRKPSYGGARYMLTIIDDYSRKVWPYFLKK